MARARSGDKERFWRALIEKQAKSGLSVGKFCTGVGVSSASFFGWKREIGRRDASGGSAPADGPALVPVRVLPAAGTEPAPAICVQWPGGMSVGACGDCDPAAFERVVVLVDGIVRRGGSPC